MCPATGATYTADDDHNRDVSSQGRYDDGAEDEEDSLFAGDDQEDTQTSDSRNRSSCRAGRGGGCETESEGIDCCRTTGLTITFGILTVVKKLSLWIIVNGLLTFVFRIIVLFDEPVVLCINIYEIEQFIIIIITIPDQWITEEPQVTINSSHLNRKLRFQCCGDGSNK